MEQQKLGFGFMRLPLNNSEDPTSIDMKQVEQMVDTFLEQGFTYFDTAYMYHQFKSEIALREALVKRHPRESFTVATKMPTMFLQKEEDLQRIFDEQLEKCGVDYFDYYLIHNLNVSHYKIAQDLDVFSFVMKKKAEGKIKNVGFSYHDNAALLDEILTAHPEMEFVQLQINYLDWDNKSIQSGLCYQAAVKHNKPIIVMEPVKGGTLANLPEEAAAVLKAENPEMSLASWAIRFAASLDKVKLVLSGMSSYEQLCDNLGYMKDFKPLNEKEQQAILKTVAIVNEAIAVPCTACQYCVEGCPENIPIPEYFALYNAKKQSERAATKQNVYNVYYGNYTKNRGKASDCIECGKCEKSCPQHIEIIKSLKAVAAVFEKTGRK